MGISPRVWQISTAILLLTTLGLLAGGIYLVLDNDKKFQDCQQEQMHPGIKDKSTKVFASLTSAEYDAVLKYLLVQNDLGLTPISNVTHLVSNYVSNIMLHMPAKSEMLAYLDANGSKPRRQALVIILMGKKSPPVVEEYLVYIESPMRHVLYTSSVKKSPIPWNSRPMTGVEIKLMIPLVYGVTKKIDFIMKESYNYSFYDCTYPQCLKPIWPLPMADRAGRRTSWLTAFREQSHIADGFYLHQLPVYIEIYHGGTDPSKFKVTKIYYNNKMFTSADDLISMYTNNQTFREFIPMPDGGSTYGSPDRRTDHNIMSDKLRPPVQYQPNGKRFSVNSNKVIYLGWTFNIHIPLIGGLQIMNVRHNGDLIAFEMSLQDIGVLYSGFPPIGFFMQVFDTSAMLGRSLFSLIRDVDCPVGAVYIDDSQYGTSTENPVLKKDVACVFELSTGTPLRRHFFSGLAGQTQSKFAFSMPDTVLVVRIIYTVFNYDYILDYIFHQNGVIEAKISPTGYMFVSPLEEPNPDLNYYGVPINHKLKIQAPIHHHIFSFKFDIDVLGTSNRFKTLDLSSEYVTHPYISGEKYALNRFVHSLKTTEENAQIQYDFNKPKYYVMYNDAFNHSNGNKRGWRIGVQGFSKLLLPEDSMPANATEWYRNQITITKHKDTEPTTASIYRQWDVHDPVISFKKFYEDNEGIVDEDLVAWVTVGLQHIPCAEDVPVTTTPGKSLSVSLQPFNYFADDPSFKSRDGVLVRRNAPDEKKSIMKTYFDKTKDRKCMPLESKPEIRDL